MSTCKRCLAQIGWTKTDDGWRPTNADGSPHRCAKKNKPIVSAGILQAGAQYVPSCGQCAVPPWEVCACSALLNSENRSNFFPAGA